MTVKVDRIALAAVLAASLTGASQAQAAGTKPGSANAAGARGAATHGIGFGEPKFHSALRTGRDQPYTWPVGDRYRPVSQPFFGRAY